MSMEDSCLGDGRPLALRTFHMHRESYCRTFGVEVECDAHPAMSIIFLLLVN